MTVFYQVKWRPNLPSEARGRQFTLSEKEIEEFSKIAVECNQRPWSLDEFTKEVI